MSFEGAEVIAALRDDVAAVEGFLFDEEAEAHDVALGDCFILIFDFEGDDVVAKLGDDIDLLSFPFAVLPVRESDGALIVSGKNVFEEGCFDR